MKYQFISRYLDAPFVTGRAWDIFVPENITQETAVFFIHGGGWSSGSRTLYHRIMEQLNDAGYLCATTDYRLANPVRPAPGKGVSAVEQLQDCREAYDEFITYLKEHDLPSKTAIFGASAGAHLASLLGCAAPGACGETVKLANDWVKPSKLILQSVPVTLEPWQEIFPPIAASIRDCACGGVSYEQDPELYRRLSMTGYLGADNPQCFYMEAGNEHMFPAELSFAAAQKQHDCGGNPVWKQYHGAEHGFFYDVSREVQQRAWTDMLKFLNDDPVSGAEQL